MLAPPHNLISLPVPLGVNEKQTVANTLGTTGIQSEVNRNGLEDMQTYFEELKVQFPQMLPEVWLDSVAVPSTHLERFFSPRLAFLSGAGN